MSSNESLTWPWLIALVLSVSACRTNRHRDAPQPASDAPSPTTSGAEGSDVLSDTKIGNGTDQDLKARHAAWFLGQAPVHACVEVAATFGLTAADAVTQLTKASAAWAAYIATTPLAHDEPPLATQLLFGDDLHCDGTEDLQFYLGIPGDEKAADAARYPAVATEIGRYTNPTAFATRQSYDEKKGRGKGFVWFSPPRSIGLDGGKTLTLSWQDPGVFYAVALHELGHVFGNGHVDGTIMRGDLNLLMASTRPPAKGNAGWLTRIDQEQELYTSLSLRRYQGALGGGYCSSYADGLLNPGPTAVLECDQTPKAAIAASVELRGHGYLGGLSFVFSYTSPRDHQIHSCTLKPKADPSASNGDQVFLRRLADGQVLGLKRQSFVATVACDLLRQPGDIIVTRGMDKDSALKLTWNGISLFTAFSPTSDPAFDLDFSGDELAFKGIRP